MKALFAAGGTGGHLFPAITIADTLTDKGVTCYFAASGLGKSQFFPRDRWSWWDIEARRPSTNPMKGMLFLFRTLLSTFMACRLIRRMKPDCVVGFGSFHTFPVLLATRLCRLPLFLFEPNVIPGRVIKLFAPYAECTGVCFSEALHTLQKNALLVQMPLLQRNSQTVSKSQACARYGLDNSSAVVLAFGGSQGAALINEYVIRALSHFEEKNRPQLLLLCGLGQDQAALEREAMARGIRAVVVPFEKEMAYAYSAADVVISRAGASTIAEIKALGKRAICIPYPHAQDNHQLLNARSLVAEGAALLVEEKNLTEEQLYRSIAQLLQEEHSTVHEEKKAIFSEKLLDWFRGRKE